MSACPHYLELATGVPDGFPQIFACHQPLDHKLKHRHNTSSQAVGPRPKGGRVRKFVSVLIEWDR